MNCLSREKAFFNKPTSDHCQERELIVASLLKSPMVVVMGKGGKNMKVRESGYKPGSQL